MAELIITAQVKNEILKNQLKEKETIQQLKTFFESIPSDTPINWIGISLKKDGKTFLAAGLAATMQSLGYKTSVYKHFYSRYVHSGPHQVIDLMGSKEEFYLALVGE